MAPLEHRAVLTYQCERALLQSKRGAFLNPDLRPLAVSPKGGEHGNVGIYPKGVVAPVARSDHAPVQVEDALQFLAIESGDWAPAPSPRERRDDAQALFTFGCG